MKKNLGLKLTIVIVVLMPVIALGYTIWTSIEAGHMLDFELKTLKLLAMGLSIYFYTIKYHLPANFEIKFISVTNKIMAFCHFIFVTYFIIYFCFAGWLL